MKKIILAIILNIITQAALADEFVSVVCHDRNCFNVFEENIKKAHCNFLKKQETKIDFEKPEFQSGFSVFRIYELLNCALSTSENFNSLCKSKTNITIEFNNKKISGCSYQKSEPKPPESDDGFYRDKTLLLPSEKRR